MIFNLTLQPALNVKMVIIMDFSRPHALKELYKIVNNFFKVKMNVRNVNMIMS